MHAEDEDEDRTVIRPPGARTQGPHAAVPPSHHATQQPGMPGASPFPPSVPPPQPAPHAATEHVTHQPTQQAAPPTQRADAPAPGGSGAHTLTLPQGTRLGEFEITSTIGEGGFGIVYLAWDHSLQRKVALKEYMPSAIASRVDGTEIRPRSERHQETFEAGLKSFINEARLLAQFDHPSLLKVYRFWEANGTAYMVMPFLEGTTLRDAVRAMPGPPDEAWILSILSPLFDALTMLHHAQIFHRDIAPDNILLMADTGRPLLLDFGAARRVIGDMTQALTAILKPGYAPVEQYAEVPGLKQGAWTDVYALAAVVHWMILGKTPSPSVGRMFDDAQVPVREKAAGRYSDTFLSAIDRALAVLPDKRTPSIDAFRQDLTGGMPITATTLPQTQFGGGGGGGAGQTVQHPGAPRTVPPTTGQRTQPATQQRTQAHGPTVAYAHEPTRQQTVPPPAGPAPAPARSRLPLAIGGGVAAVAIAVAAVLFWPKPAPTPATGTTATPATAAPATTTATPPAATTTPPATTAPPPATTTPPVATSPPVTTPPATDPPAATTATPATTEPAGRTTAATPTSPATGGDGGSSAGTGTRTPPTTAQAPARRPPREPAPRTESPRTDYPRTETPRTETARSEPPPRAEPRPAATASDNSAECARILTKISLGNADLGDMDRYRTLRCR